MKKLLVAVTSIAALYLQAATPPSGSNRLRELVVFPELNLTFNFGMSFQGGEFVVNDGTTPGTEISRLRQALKRRPDNIGLLLRLGVLLGKNDETNASQICWRKAERLARNRIAAQPQDGLALTELGEALWQLDKDAEAEHDYRQAVLVSSNDWRCWVGLGSFLASEPFGLMFPKNLRDQVGASLQAPPPEVLDYRPPREAFQRAQTSLREASRYFDRAITLAPAEPEVSLHRAGYMSVSNWENCFFQHFRTGRNIDSTQLAAALLSPETIANLQKAADLNPKNYKFVSLAAYFTYFGALLQAHWPAHATVQTLPDKARRSIRIAMTRLENLSHSPDKHTAAAALENLGFLQMAFHNLPAARSDFRRSVTLDPTRDTAWDLLLATMLRSASPEKLVSLCEARLKYKDSERNHLFLAKALVREEKWSKAAAQAEIAAKLETNNVVPPLLMAAIALKQSAQASYLTTAAVYMKQVYFMLQKMPAGKEKTDRVREFSLDCAIYNALSNHPDLTKDWANQVLKGFPNDETAKKILEALH
ncbi:MAG: hypothetical protein KGJ60_12750 [Verrucomicrobiota bacterium]|nr:hypothetical protein [Verrucomicrobiota bacterium]